MTKLELELKCKFKNTMYLTIDVKFKRTNEWNGELTLKQFSNAFHLSVNLFHSLSVGNGARRRLQTGQHGTFKLSVCLPQHAPAGNVDANRCQRTLECVSDNC